MSGCNFEAGTSRLSTDVVAVFARTSAVDNTQSIGIAEQRSVGQMIRSGPLPRGTPNNPDLPAIDEFAADKTVAFIGERAHAEIDQDAAKSRACLDRLIAQLGAVTRLPVCR